MTEAVAFSPPSPVGRGEHLGEAGPAAFRWGSPKAEKRGNQGSEGGGVRPDCRKEGVSGNGGLMAWGQRKALKRGRRL